MIFLGVPPCKIFSVFFHSDPLPCLIAQLKVNFRKCWMYNSLLCNWNIIHQWFSHIYQGPVRLNVQIALIIQKSTRLQHVLSSVWLLTHWGRLTHVCHCELTIIGSHNDLSPGLHQAIIWTNAGVLLIGPLGTNFSEILIEIYIFSFKKMHLKLLSGIWRPFCLGLNVLNISRTTSIWIWRSTAQLKFVRAIYFNDMKKETEDFQ